MNRLQVSSSVRSGVLGVTGLLVFFGLTQLVLPGPNGEGTPMAILFDGGVRGVVNSLMAVGLVLVYRSHRVINFAQFTLGVIGAMFVYNLTALVGFPFFLSVMIGVGVGALTGLGFELGVVRRFFQAPRLILTIFTLVAIAVLVGMVPQMDFRLPLWPGLEERTFEQLNRGDIPLPFESFTFQVGEFPLRFGFPHIFAIAICIASLVALGAFLRFTRLGVAVRASAENAERAQMLGISVHVVSSVVWSLAGALSAVAIISQHTVVGQFPHAIADPQGFLLALAAAVVARMHSLGVAGISAAAMTVLWEAFRHSYPDDINLLPLFLLVILAGALLLGRRRLGRSEESEASSWQAIEEPRPIPQQMREIPAIESTRRAAIALLAVGVLVFPWIVPSRQVNLGGYYALVAIVVLSLVVLTGWAGQVSLGQFAFVAIGAVLGGALTSRVGMSFWLAILIAPVLTAAITSLVSFPALRMKGLFLGVATLALAFTVQGVLFQDRYFGWLLPGEIDRPRIFLLDFDDERTMYYFAVAVLTLCVMAVVGLRRSRTGRLLIGLRENEANVQAFGVSPVRMRMVAFATSGYLCGLAGFLLAHHQRAISEATFPAELSIQIFVVAMLGGVGSVAGVVVGVAYLAAATDFIGDDFWRFVIAANLPFIVLWLSPGGFVQIAVIIRDNVLRIVAQRRQMVVPSLFADVDPEVMEKQLIPLAEALPSSGADGLASTGGYQVTSELYGELGKPKSEAGRTDVEAAALGAAVRRLEGSES